MSRSIAFAAVCALAVTGAGAVLVPKALPRPSPRAADGTVVAIPPPPSGVAGAGSCLEHAGPLVTLSGSIGRYDTRKTAVTAQRVDARAASWTGTEQWAVNAGRSSAPGLCWSGGVIRGLWPPDTPWDTWHHTGALLLYSPKATVEQVVISDYGDGVRIEDGAQQWTIRQSRVTRAHDDCVENDWEYSGLIEDSFFEGCYVFLSERPASRQTGVRDGSGDTVSIRSR